MISDIIINIICQGEYFGSETKQITVDVMAHLDKTAYPSL